MISTLVFAQKTHILSKTRVHNQVNVTLPSMHYLLHFKHMNTIQDVYVMLQSRWQKEESSRFLIGILLPELLNGTSYHSIHIAAHKQMSTIQDVYYELL